MKKIIIIALSFLAIITGFMSVNAIKKMSKSVTFDNNGEKVNIQNQTVYVNTGPLIKIEYEETVKLDNNIEVIKTKINNIELLNRDAESIYYNYNYINKDIYEVIEDILEISQDNNYDISNVDIIYTSNNFTSDSIEVNPLTVINDNYQDSIDKQSIIRYFSNYYQVYFDTDGGSTVVNQSISKNGKVEVPDVPTKEGYTFVCWQLNGETYDFEEPVSSSITLKAVWEEIPVIINTYKIIFDTKGGSKISKQNIAEGQTVKEPKDPVKKGYLFMGWTVDDESYNFDTPVYSNMTIIANWAAVKKN